MTAEPAAAAPGRDTAHATAPGAAPPQRVFHVSERADITRFEPRTPPSFDAGVREPVVWAIAARLLHNYLLPRDCPRVTFHAQAHSRPQHLARLMGRTRARHVVAVEAAWLQQIRESQLWVYELPAQAFTEIDRGAGYHVSRQPVEPLRLRRIDDILAALTERAVELRVLDTLWPLHDAVVASSLQFSCIRMRNAQPRESSKAVGTLQLGTPR